MKSILKVNFIFALLSHIISAGVCVHFGLQMLAISWYKLTNDGFVLVVLFFRSIQGELDAEAEKMRVSQQDLIAVNESVYTPDSDVTSPAINRNLIQKAGYLNLRK